MAGSHPLKELEDKLEIFVKYFTESFYYPNCRRGPFQSSNASGSRPSPGVRGKKEEELSPWLSHLGSFKKKMLNRFSEREKKYPIMLVIEDIPLINAAIESAFTIFQKFEAQFNDDEIMHMLGVDLLYMSHEAAKLADHYIHRRIEVGDRHQDWRKEIIRGLLVEGFRGVSKEEGQKHAEGIFSVANFFAKPGIVFQKGDSIIYYAKTDDKDSKFGFRLPFDWESEELLISWKYKQISDCVGQTYDYILKGDDFRVIVQRVMERLEYTDHKLFGKEFTKQEVELHSIDFFAKGIVDSEEKGIVESEKKGISEFEKKGIVESEKKGIVESEKEEVIFPIRFGIEHPLNNFTRLRELESLEMKLSSGNIYSTSLVQNVLVISGLGGIGKTEFARQYVSQYAANRNVVWINSNNLENLNSSFSKLSKELRLRTYDGNGVEMKLDSLVENILRFLAKEDCLFVFDDVEQEVWNKIILSKLQLSYSVPFKILITSRTREWARGIEMFQLDGFSVEDAFSVFREGLPEKWGKDSMDWLLGKLDFFPLAIDEVVQYLREERNHMLIRDIENILSGKQVESLAFLELFHSYTTRFREVLKFSIEKIRADKASGELALQVLDALAFLGPKNIPRDFLVKGFAPVDERRIKEAVRLLVKYSIVDGEKYQWVLSVHPMVQLVVRMGLEDVRRENVLKNVVQMLTGAPFSSTCQNEELGNKSDMETLIFHLESCVCHVKEWTQGFTLHKSDMEDTCLIPLLSQLAKYYSLLGNTGTEKHYLHWIISIVSERGQEGPWVEYMNRLANAYEKEFVL